MDAPALTFSLGVLALIIASAFVFARKPGLRLASREEAARLFLVDHWDAPVRAVSLSGDGRAALLELDGGEVGIVSVFGDRAVTRRLPAKALRVAGRGDGLELRLPDASLPRLRLDLAPDEHARWAARLDAQDPALKAEARAA
ncbi:hypothetical protein E5163_14615 [Marinicauda algicola]|uniref:Uncharacterized protein n=1 Tax=Marinicauda algicola TaxID=2029849 RepID=A0A4S2GY13_9PROT|nr:hypothetical protein [Marinicauda algicola]TGY87662.1 hypothetical protein E5163_14615 [Marinicauda algicola]